MLEDERGNPGKRGIKERKQRGREVGSAGVGWREWEKRQRTVIE